MSASYRPGRHAEGADSTRLSEILERFEGAWQSGPRPTLEAFLPPGAAERRAALVELAAVDLEYRLKAGEPARVEEYLRRYPELVEGPSVLVLIAVEYGQRRCHEPARAAHELLRRFPEHEEEFRRRWAMPAGQETDRIVPGPTQPGAAPEDCPDTPPAGAPRTSEPAGNAPTVPGYEILGELGRGGMGIVYKARQVALRRVVALKMIRAGVHPDEEDLRRFRREAEAVARLGHPHIVQIYEVGEVDGRPFFSLEFIEAGSLDKRLNGTPLRAARAAPLVEALARAVHYAHERGIIHRDLKPANILLAGNPKSQIPNPNAGAPGISDLGFGISDLEPKVTDFGLAKYLDQEPGQTQSGAILGTPSYMAPEQAEGKTREVRPATDVYALGAVLYELLTGRPPFKAAEVLDTLVQVVNEEPVPPRRLNPQVPRDLETVCLKCLRKDPRKRYASALGLAEDLRRWQAREPIAARPVGALERLGRWCWRYPTRAGLILTGGLLLVGVTLVLAWYLREQQARELRRLQRGARVEAALAEASSLMEQARAMTQAPALWEATLTKAAAALRQAEGVLEDPEGDTQPPLVERTGQLRRQLASAENDRRLLARLERIHLDQEMRGNLSEMGYPRDGPRRIRQAFAAAGIDESLPPQQAAAWLVRRPVPVQAVLLAHLYEWGALEVELKGKRDGWVWQMVRRADKDPWRRRVREAALKLQLGELMRLVEQVDVSRQPPGGLMVIASALERYLDDPTPAIRLLRRAQDQYPGHFYINCDLGEYLLESNAGRHADEAIACYRAALAAQPGNTFVYYRLGHAYLLRRDGAQALKHYRKAMRTTPHLAEDVRFFHRSRAAVAAIMQADGSGQTALQKQRLRGEALQWMRADLAGWVRLWQTGAAPHRKAAERILTFWRTAPLLRTVRDPEALRRLSREEQAAWQQFWHDADALGRQVRQKTAAGCR